MSVVVNERLEAARRVIKELRDLHGGNRGIFPKLDLLEDVLMEFGAAEEELLRKNVQLFDFREDSASANLRYRELLDSMPDPCLLTDPEGVIIESNPAAGNILKADTIVFKSIDILIGPDFIEKHSQALRSGCPVRQECAVSVPGGPRLLMDLEAARALGRRPGTWSVRWIFREKSSEKPRAEEYAKALRQVIDSLDSVITIKDASGRYLIVNSRFESIFGAARGSVTGKTPHEIFPMERSTALLFNDAEVIGKRSRLEYEEELIVKGRTRKFITSKFPIMDSRGAVRAVCAVSNEFPARGGERNEGALRGDLGLLKAIMDNSSSAIYIKDRESKFLFVNKWYEKSLHVRRESILGKSTRDLYPREIAERLIENDRKVLEGGATLQTEEKVLIKDGLRHFMTNKFPVYGPNGEIAAVCGISTDITELKRSQERITKLNRILRTFYEINHLIIRETDRRKLLERTCGILVEHGGFACAWIGMVEGRSGALSTAAHACSDAKASDGFFKWKQSVEGFDAKRPSRRGEVFVCNGGGGGDGIADHDWMKAALDSGFRSCASVPVFVRGAATGVINLFSSEPDTFGPELIELLNELAGNIGYALQAFVEIEERKSAQALLHTSERKFHEVLESVPVGIILARLDSGIIDINNEAVTVFGFSSRDEFMAADPHSHYCEAEDRTKIYALLQEQGGEREIELRLRRKDGTPFWAYVTLTKRVEESGGYFIATVQDITSRKISEEALKESEERFRQIFEQSTDAQLILDMNTCGVLDSSPGTTALFGFSRDEIMEKGPALFIADKDMTRFQEAVYCNCENCSFELERLECVRKDGSTAIVTLRGQTIRLRNCRVKYCTMRDITGIVRMEEEARFIQARLIHANKMTSIGTLASGVAHEINNPNNFILFNSSLLAEAWDDASKILNWYSKENGEFSIGGLPYSEMSEIIPELLSGITEGARRIKGIIDNLKDFSKMDRGGLDAEFDVNQAVSSALSMIGTQVNKYTEKFSMELGKGLPPVRGSIQKIEQVIINLIMNSLQALPARSCAVGLETGYNNETGMVEIIVRDEGCGMTPEVLERITEPFYTTKNDSGGMGLGLSISYSIIKEHKGSIEFTSEPGRGTQAKIVLPAAAGGHDASGLEQARNPGTRT